MVESVHRLRGPIPGPEICTWISVKPLRPEHARRRENCCSPHCGTQYAPGACLRAPCCRRLGHWPPTWDWPATPSPRPMQNWSRRAGWRRDREQAHGWSTPAARNCPPVREVFGSSPTHNLMPGSAQHPARFPAQRMGGRHAKGAGECANEALRMGDPRGRPELRDALAEYLAQGARSPYVAGLDRHLRRRSARRRAAGPGFPG